MFLTYIDVSLLLFLPPFPSLQKINFFLKEKVAHTVTEGANVHQEGHPGPRRHQGQFRPSLRDSRVPGIPIGRTYILGVPGPIAHRCPGHDDHVSCEDRQQQEGTHDLPGRPPVETRPPPRHPCYVVTEPARDSGLRSPTRPCAGKPTYSASSFIQCHQDVTYGACPPTSICPWPMCLLEQPPNGQPSQILMRTQSPVNNMAKAWACSLVWMRERAGQGVLQGLLALDRQQGGA